MADKPIEPDEAGVDVAAFFAAESANLSFASTAAMRGGSDAKTRLSAVRQRKAENYFKNAGKGIQTRSAAGQHVSLPSFGALGPGGSNNGSLPWPVMHPGLIFPDYGHAQAKIEQSPNLAQSSTLSKHSLGANPTLFDENNLPSLFQPGRKPENHFANSARVIRSPRAPRIRGDRALHSPTPAADTRRGRLLANTQRSDPIALQFRAQVHAAAHQKPLVHTALRNVVPTADKAFGGLGASKHSPIHLRIARGEQEKPEVKSKVETRVETKIATNVEVKAAHKVTSETQWSTALESDDSVIGF